MCVLFIVTVTEAKAKKQSENVNVKEEGTEQRNVNSNGADSHGAGAAAAKQPTAIQVKREHSVSVPPNMSVSPSPAANGNAAEILTALSLGSEEQEEFGAGTTVDANETKNNSNQPNTVAANSDYVAEDWLELRKCAYIPDKLPPNESMCFAVPFSGAFLVHCFVISMF